MTSNLAPHMDVCCFLFFIGNDFTAVIFCILPDQRYKMRMVWKNNARDLRMLKIPACALKSDIFACFLIFFHFTSDLAVTNLGFRRQSSQCY
jgi:hypothetical protein